MLNTLDWTTSQRCYLTMEMTMDTDQWEQPVEMSTAEESYGDASAAEAVTVNDAGQIGTFTV
ncbi:hypothetical protein AtubIFM55763_007854 [Aspergillus tubingensis]|uniref:Uncharacterized protein n=1 Tax=Aspergillus tubingensis TaxID=5068 RepID=A0A9W6EN25_ASPTU|nr:hypothetical protein AtubIFM55763_007854 [Aspergillus tubingensis]GLA87056.1 hypothetical protein AtubIFM56815_011328 [Aspergillus tubingensis]GLB23633.1 hypothetical protein AtubIFM61612_004230 [Aspergillus tubingensis]